MANNVVKEKKCPACGAPMVFDPESGKMLCEFCGTTMDVTKPEEGEVKLEGFDFEKMADRDSGDPQQGLSVYRCVSCGAEVIAPPEQLALTCPYCQNNIVLTDKLAGTLKPDGIIPFRINSKGLPAAVKNFYSGRKLLPKNFFSETKLGKVTGIYVPFWVFDGDVSGELVFSGEIDRMHREGDYDVIDTSHYKVARKVNMNFANLPVDASSRIDDELMDSVEPFDFSEEKAFSTDFLAGFTADRFDIKADDLSVRAENRMKGAVAAMAQREALTAYQRVSATGGDLKLNAKARYMLLPVYLFDIMHGDTKYSFAMNGQSGKVVGDLPDFGKEAAALFFKTAAIVVPALFVLLMALYMVRG